MKELLLSAKSGKACLCQIWKSFSLVQLNIFDYAIIPFQLSADFPIGVSIPHKLESAVYTTWRQYTSGYFSRLQPTRFGISARRKFDNVGLTVAIRKSELSMKFEE